MQAVLGYLAEQGKERVPDAHSRASLRIMRSSIRSIITGRQGQDKGITALSVIRRHGGADLLTGRRGWGPASDGQPSKQNSLPSGSAMMTQLAPGGCSASTL